MKHSDVTMVCLVAGLKLELKHVRLDSFGKLFVAKAVCYFLLK